MPSPGPDRIRPVALDPTLLLAADPPSVTTGAAADLAREHFAVAGTADPLAGERDRNFRIVAADSSAFVLKIANAAEPAGLGAFQQAALRHVAAADPSLPVPRVRLTRSDALEASVVLDGARHSLRMVTYLGGTSLAGTPPSTAQAGAVGRGLAALGAALRGFDHPVAEHEILWDLAQAPNLRPLMMHIADAGTRGRVRAVLDRYEDVVRPQAAAFRRQVVHNDCNPSNLLVDPADPTRLAGILDFGDMVRTALVNDLAIAAAYHVGGEDPLARPLAMAAGYHAVVPLRPEELDSLFDLIALRVVLTVTIGAWRADLHPGNKTYVLRHQARAVAALDHLAALGSAEGTKRFKEACG